MKRNNRNSISLFVVAAFSAVFLFAGRADAQNTNDVELPIDSPQEACQYYENRWEKGLISVVKDAENECLVRVGDSNTGFGYVRGYYSGNKFCLDSYGAYFNNAGLSDASECISVSRTDKEQQQKTSPETLTPLPVFEHLKSFLNELYPKIVTFFQTTQTVNKIIIGGGLILFIVMLFAKRKKIFRRQEKKQSTVSTISATKEEKGKADREGLAIGSFVFGIITVITSHSSFLTLLKSISFLNYLLFSSADYGLFFFLMGIIGLILGIIGLKLSKKKIFAVLGIILNIIGILLW